MRSFKIEGCITKNIEDRLRNGLWLEFNVPGCWILYDENANVIDELFASACGIKAPMTGNVVYDNTIFWQLTELQRSIFISKKISVLTNDEFYRLQSKTLFEVFYEEFYFDNIKTHKLNETVYEFLKQIKMAEFTLSNFENLPEQMQYEILYQKIIYKQPDFIHINIFPSKTKTFNMGKFVEFLKLKCHQEKRFCFIYTNDNQFNFLNDIVQINDAKNYYVSGMVYSVYQDLSPVENRLKKGITNFLKGLVFFNKFNLKHLIILVSCVLVITILNGFLNSYDFVTSFNLSLNFDFNALLQSLGICFQIFVDLTVLYYFFMKRKKIDTLINFLITKGNNRMGLINIYLFWAISLFVSGILLNVIINLIIINFSTPLVLINSGIIWSILINFLIYALGLIPHYLHFFKIWRINFRYIIKDFQKQVY